MDKAFFLENELVRTIGSIDPATAPLWGKMNLQQMTEHLGREGFGWASGRIPQDKILTPPDVLPRMQAFLTSEKQFREHTVNELMAAEPPALEHSGMPAALAALQAEIDHFFAVYRADTGRKGINPFFGELDYEMWLLLLYKHATHHLRQFGVTLS